MQDISFLIEDCPHTTAPDEGSGYPLVRTPNIGEGYLILEGVHRVSEETYHKRNVRAVPQTDDIVYAREAPAGNAAVIKKEEIICLGQRTVLIRPAKNYVDSNLLAYFILSPYSRNRLISKATGSTVQHVNMESIRPHLIPLPPYNEQLRIVDKIKEVLSLVDELVESEITIHHAVDQAKSKILELAIHGKLVPQDANDDPASELLKRINPRAVTPCDNPQYGKVPSSWVISTIGEVFTINPKTHVEDDTEAAFVPMTCVSDGYSNTFEYECRKWGDIKKGFVHFQENDVAVAKMSPCLENRKSVVFHDLPNGIGAGTTELNVFRCVEILPEYALFYFKSEMFIGSCAGTYNGVVGQQRVAKSFIQELPIGIPPYKEQLRIVSKVNNLFSQLDMIEKIPASISLQG